MVENCNRPVIQNTHYCNDHLCPYGGCQKARGFANESCRDHQCEYTFCSRKAADGTSRCAIHTCRVKDCKNPADYAPVASLCSYHVCSYFMATGVRCSKPVIAGHRSCEEHRCKLGGCPNARKTYPAVYCKVHGCNFPDCTTPVVNGAQACSTHQGYFSAA